MWITFREHGAEYLTTLKINRPCFRPCYEPADGSPDPTIMAIEDLETRDVYDTAYPSAMCDAVAKVIYRAEFELGGLVLLDLEHHYRKLLADQEAER